MSLHDFESRFAILDELPETIYAQVVTHPHGALLERAKGVMQWRNALLKGRLPDRHGLLWPNEVLTRTILMRLETLDIVRYCKDEEALTDSILETLLEGVSSAEDYFGKAGEFDDKLAQRQKIRDRDSEFEDDEGISDHVDSPSGDQGENAGQEAGADAGQGMEGGHGGTGEAAATAGENQISVTPVSPDDPASEREASIPAPQEDGDHYPDAEPSESGSEALISSETAAPPAALSATIDRQWGELAKSWRELSPVLEELGAFTGRGWDLTQGILATQGWRDIVRYRRLIKSLPELVRLIEIMGRLRNAGAENEKTLIEEVTEPLQRGIEKEQAHRSTLAINTTEGIKLSDDIARMLPAESALLGHPVLNTLWHAKRAESTLRCYQLQGVLSEHTPLPELEEQPAADEPALPGHGPIIICMDSSASMEGEPEAIAKALALEALRIAAGEKRDCFVYTFSGEEQMVTYELDLKKQGYRALLAFLQQSFHGGTDVAAPLRKALQQLAEKKWRQADILLISDGRFPLPDGLSEEIAAAKDEYDVRIHGLLLGRWRGQAMAAICDPLHRFDHWGTGR